MTALTRGAQVELKNVRKYHGSVRAVDDISLTVRAGEFFTLLGPSGSGKTTTLTLIAGFDRADSGEIRIGNREVTAVPAYARDLGFVFQNYALFPHMTVRQNLAFPLTTRGVGNQEIGGRIDQALDRVRLAGLGERYPNQLSGGQQQRVALARALIFNPPVLLMDEPLGALDKKLREQMQLEIKHIQRELNLTVIYVTHDQEEALTMSDRIAVMRDGKIVQIGAPEEVYERPADRFVADFLGEANFLEGRVQGWSGNVLRAKSEDGIEFAIERTEAVAVGDRICVALRPERVQLAKAAAQPAPGRYRAVVKEAIYIGQIRKYRLDLGKTSLIASQQVGDGKASFEHGDAVDVGWNRTDLRWIARDADDKT